MSLMKKRCRRDWLLLAVLCGLLGVASCQGGGASGGDGASEIVDVGSGDAPGYDAAPDEDDAEASDLGPGGDSDAGDEPPGSVVEDPDPDLLNQDALFVCDGTPGSSPARIRRIERDEWVHNIGKSTTGTHDGSLAPNNPFDPPVSLPYRTYDRDVSIDAATIDLYFGVIDEAGISWTASAPRHGIAPRRAHRVLEDDSLKCMFLEAAPDEACVDNYLRTFLEFGAYLRPPSDDEVEALRVFTEVILGEEAESGAPRWDSLRRVTAAAWMTTGALFRTEWGRGEADEHGRHRLTDAELGQAVAYMLSDRGPGAVGIFTHGEGPPEHVNWSAPYEGYLADIAAAARDGSIQDPATLAELVRRNAGGVDEGRFDLSPEYRSDRRDRRGQYWLGAKVRRFFQQWLGTSDFSTKFKDTPQATSRFESGDFIQFNIERSYSNLQSGRYGSEATLDQQLDDMIARIVVEDEQVLRELLTSRRFYVASNTAYSDANFYKNTTEVHRPYNLDDDTAPTREARWRTLPSDERAGVLTHPVWLASHGGNFEDDGSLIYRGKWVREQLLCQTVPPLELVMVEAQLVASDPSRRARDRVAQSIESNPTCMGCHSMMNSLGYPFEVYNHAGFLRAEDHGQAPDGSSLLELMPDPALNGPVSDAVEMMERMASSEHVQRCFIRHTFRYFMGRDETAADACTLASMESAYHERGGSFIAMLEALAQSDAFLYRSYVDEGAP